MKKLSKKFKKTNKTLRILFYLISVIYLIGLILFIKSIASLSGIETALRFVFGTFFVLYFLLYIFINIASLIKRKYKKFILTSILSLLFSCVFYIGSYYIDFIYHNLGNMQESDNLVYTTYLIKLKDSKFDKDSIIGLIEESIDDDTYYLADKLMDKYKLKNEVIEYNDYLSLVSELYNEKVDAIFVPSNYVALFSSEDGFSDIEGRTEVLYKYSEKRRNDDLVLSNKDFTEPLTFLILGVDSETDGLKDNASFNGDTLMIASFNPSTLDMMILSIPRDTYVPIACNNNKYAKINSSAAYGTSCVINTINDFLDIDIDYYVKINFKGVVDLVEAVGGVEVNVEAPTYQANKYNGKVCEQNSDRQFGSKLVCMDPGMQTLNGEQALAYARCRHLYISSDLDRVRHQQQVVEALANKVIKLRSVKEFQNLFESVSNNIATNMDTNTILSGYNVLKSVVGNMISGEELLTIKKATLETYDLDVYQPSYGNITSAQGYYNTSLEDIKNSFNVILGKKEEEPIKTFSFSVNDTFEEPKPGKGKRSNPAHLLLPSFEGKTVSDAEKFCEENNISLTIKYVDSESDYYNNKVSVGLIGNQSVYKNSLLSSVSKLTVYVVNSKDTSNKSNKSDEKEKSEVEEDIINDLIGVE